MVEKIKSLCASRGISLNDLERSCDGLSVNTIYRWDNAPPSVWKVKAVADYFGVSVDYLLGRETSISASDADLLRKYHALTDVQREAIDGAIDGFLARNPSSKQEIS